MICLNIDDSAAVENKVNQAGKLVVNVEDNNVTFTIIETFTGSEEVAGNTAFRICYTMLEKQSCKACTGVVDSQRSRMCFAMLEAGVQMKQVLSLYSCFLEHGSLYDGIRTEP